MRASLAVTGQRQSSIALRMDELDEGRPLRRGWTTGACATAAAKAAFTALLTGEFPDPVEITLAGRPARAFALAVNREGDGARRPAWSRTRATIPTSRMAR